VNGRIVILPERPVARARLMIARPDQHEDVELLAACELLATFGDPVDVERADLLKASIVARAVADLNKQAQVLFPHPSDMCRRADHRMRREHEVTFCLFCVACVVLALLIAFNL
jgi:hypothetical protein